MTDISKITTLLISNDDSNIQLARQLIIGLDIDYDDISYELLNNMKYWEIVERNSSHDTRLLTLNIKVIYISIHHRDNIFRDGNILSMSVNSNKETNSFHYHSDGIFFNGHDRQSVIRCVSRLIRTKLNEKY
jgi:hypothetical protein